MKEIYITYNASQLAGEDEFIAWVMHDLNAEAWKTWISLHPDKAREIEEGKRIVRDLSKLNEYELDQKEEAALWNRISTDTLSSAKPKNVSRPSLFRWSTIAAAAAIALLVWFVTKDQITTHVLASAGERKEIMLPESSQVQLNAGSALSYNKKQFTADRELTLDGEAFFKVHPGSRFTVKTKQGSVTVLGTSFNVIARDGRFEVSCYTGKVMVENEHNEKVTITPGEKCYSEEKSGTLKTNPFDLSNMTPEWIKGKFVFQDQPYKVVVAELERQYNVKVNLASGLEDIRYTGLFEAGDLDKALSLITWPLHLQAEKKGDTISIGR